MTLTRLLIIHAIFRLDYRLREIRPTEHHHDKWEEHACCEQLPFEVHAEPGDGVWFEVGGVSREGVWFSEGFSDGVEDALGFAGGWLLEKS